MRRIKKRALHDCRNGSWSVCQCVQHGERQLPIDWTQTKKTQKTKWKMPRSENLARTTKSNAERWRVHCHCAQSKTSYFCSIIDLTLSSRILCWMNFLILFFLLFLFRRSCSRYAKWSTLLCSGIIWDCVSDSFAVEVCVCRCVVLLSRDHRLCQRLCRAPENY